MMKSVRSKLIPFTFFLIPFLVEIIYLLAFYPGILTFDSVNQWDQLSRSSFTNWHPAYHTILMWMITRIWYSPAAVALFQILVYSLTIAYGLTTFWQEFGVPYGLLVLVDILVSLVPLNGLIIITLWKDILYSLFVLLLTICLLKIIKSRGDWIAVRSHWIFLGIIAANISLFRFNGFPVALGTILVCFLFRKFRKYILSALIIAVAYFLVVVGPVYALFKVDRSSSQPAEVVFLNPIAAHVHAGVRLTDSQREFLNTVFPLDQGWKYSCYDETVFFYTGVNFKPLQEHPLVTSKILWDLTLKHPKPTIESFLCLSSFTWQIQQPKNVSLETVLSYNVDVSNRPYWKMYQPIVQQNSKSPLLQNTLRKLVTNSFSIDQNDILLRPAFYMYLFILVTLVAFIFSRNKFILLLLAPILLQTVVIAFTAQLQAVRYQYPVYLTAMLFSIPLVVATVKKTVALDS